METIDLMRMIAAAFPVEPVPGPSEILYEGAYPGESELEEIKSFFGGRPWNRVTPQDVFRFRHALSFFSHSAFSYFTPAWMTSSLLDQAAVDTGIEDLVGALGRREISWTKDQRRAICEWLHYSQLNIEDLESVRRDFAVALSKVSCAPESKPVN
jgi:hypothetical protein